MESSGPFFGSSASADLIAALRTVEEPFEDEQVYLGEALDRRVA